MYGGAPPPTTGRRPTAPGKSAPAICSGRREELTNSHAQGVSDCLGKLLDLERLGEMPVKPGCEILLRRAPGSRDGKNREVNCPALPDSGQDPLWPSSCWDPAPAAGPGRTRRTRPT